MPEHITLKDPHRESRIYSARTVTAVVLVMGLLAIVLVRYYALQITEYETYRTQSDRNRVQLQPLPPKRGLIYDRNGVLLADNRPSYILSVVREQVSDLEATLAELQALVPVAVVSVRRPPLLQLSEEGAPDLVVEVERSIRPIALSRK